MKKTKKKVKFNAEVISEILKCMKVQFRKVVAHTEPYIDQVAFSWQKYSSFILKIIPGCKFLKQCMKTHQSAKFTL